MNLAAGLIAVRFALYVDLMLVFGLPLFALYTAQPRRNDGSAVPPSRALSAWSLAGARLPVLGLLLIAATMSDVALFQLDRESVNGLLNGTVIGTAGKVRVATLLMARLLGLVLSKQMHHRFPKWLRESGRQRLS
jgi:putative copper resistance protein D